MNDVIRARRAGVKSGGDADGGRPAAEERQQFAVDVLSECLVDVA